MTSFVAQRLSAELLLGQLSAEHPEADVRRVLLQVRPGRLPAACRLPRGVGGGGGVPAPWECGPATTKCRLSPGWSADPARSSAAEEPALGAPTPGGAGAGGRSSPHPSWLGWL